MSLPTLGEMTSRRPIRLVLTALLALAFAVVVACDDDGPPAASPTATAAKTPDVTATAGGEPAPTPTLTGTPGAPSASTPRPTPASTPEAPPLRGDIPGWFTDPRPAGVLQSRTLGPRPASPFAARTRGSVEVVLYDTRTMTERVLGIGGYADFSPDGTRLAWVTGAEPHRWTELRVLDLSSGDQRGLGKARSLRWVDDDAIVVHEVENIMAVVDVTTGAHRPADGVNLNPVARSAEEAGYRLERVTVHEPYPFWRSTYRVTTLASGVTFEFDAYRAVLAPDGTVFLATVSEPATRKRPTEGPDVGVMTSNIFAVDPRTRQATFVATAEPSFPNWPFDASARHVIWQDRACDPQPSTRLYDRRAGVLAEVEGASVAEPTFTTVFWPAKFTPAGAIASGVFGAKTLLDPDTLGYLVVLPEGFADVSWSRDYRYAAVSTQLGHGGLCG